MYILKKKPNGNKRLDWTFEHPLYKKNLDVYCPVIYR